MRFFNACDKLIVSVLIECLNAHDKLIVRTYCQLPELEAALDRWTDLADGTITPLVSAQLRDTVAHLNSVCQAPPSVLGIVQVMRKTSDGLLVATHSLYTRDAAGTTTRVGQYFSCTDVYLILWLLTLY